MIPTVDQATPTISIIVPTYNRAAFLPEALDSIRAQTYQDWELLVIDDGSTDNTEEIIRQYPISIRYLHQTNQGVSAARNRGVREARGTYVLFLDSDDFLLPSALAFLADVLRRDSTVSIVYSDGYVVDTAGTRLAQLSDYRQTSTESTLDSMVLVSPIVGLHSAMIRRSVLAPLDGPFDEKMVNQEDHDLFIRLMVSGCRFLYLPEFTCCYRFHGGNASAPKSAMAEKHRQSRIYGRMKVLNSTWFDSLSLPARQQFFLGLLIDTLKHDYELQEQVLTHPAFAKLPARERSKLLYYLAVENLLCGSEVSREEGHLSQAIRLRPQSPRPYLLWTSCLFGPHLPKLLIQVRRREQSGSAAVDPVTQILRSKGVA